MKQVSFSLKAIVVACMAAASMPSYALEEMKETEMSDATGEGIAFLAEQYSLTMGDTDYIKMTSTSGGTVDTGKKGEVYVYGLKIGGTSAANEYNRQVVPVNVGTAANPARIRIYKSDFVPVFDPNTGTGSNTGKAQIDVFEIAYPKREFDTGGNLKVGSEENLKWSAWLDALGRDAVAYDDGIVNGIRPNRVRGVVMADKMSWNGTYIQQWKTPEHPTNPEYSNKVGMSGFLRANTAEDGYLRISADIRSNPSPITATETSASNARFGDAYVTSAPTFGADGPANDNKEGFYWKNFQNNMPLGILGYQPSIVSAGGASGRELVVEVARIPDNEAAYNAAYINYDNLDNGTPAEKAIEEAKMCTATSCPSTATHATLSYQVHTRLKDGSYIGTGTDAGYYGLGLGSNLNNPGSAGISPGTNGNTIDLEALEVLGTGTKSNVATQGGTYNKFEGMFVQHLKITTKAFD